MDNICVMLIKLCMEGNTFACIKGGNSYTKMNKIYLALREVTLIQKWTKYI